MGFAATRFDRFEATCRSAGSRVRGRRVGLGSSSGGRAEQGSGVIPPGSSARSGADAGGLRSSRGSVGSDVHVPGVRTAVARTVATPSRFRGALSVVASWQGLWLQQGDSSPRRSASFSLSTLCSRAMATSHERVGRRMSIQSVALVLKGARASVRVGFRPSWGSLRPGRLHQVAPRWSGSCDEARLAFAVWLAATSAGSFGASKRDMGLARSLAEEYAFARRALASSPWGCGVRAAASATARTLHLPGGTPEGVDPSGFRRRPWRHGWQPLVCWNQRARFRWRHRTHEPRGRHVGGDGIYEVTHPRGRSRVLCATALPRWAAAVEGPRSRGGGLPRRKSSRGAWPSPTVWFLSAVASCGG